MSKEFKVGERVAFYANGLRGIAEINFIDSEGSLALTNIDKYGRTNMGVAFHPKQCRRLIKKQRRRVWISKVALTDCKDKPTFSTFAYLNQPTMHSKDWIEFIEVKKS